MVPNEIISGYCGWENAKIFENWSNKVSDLKLPFFYKIQFMNLTHSYCNFIWWNWKKKLHNFRLIVSILVHCSPQFFCQFPLCANCLLGCIQFFRTFLNIAEKHCALHGKCWDKKKYEISRKYKANNTIWSGGWKNVGKKWSHLDMMLNQWISGMKC